MFLLGDEIMKRILWDILVDANTYGVFETSLGKESFLVYQMN
jgi:hypothetical protein